MSFIMRKKKKYGTNTDGRVSYILRLLGDSSLKTKSDKVTDAINELADMIYPVGSIYMSVNNVNPSTLFGGTWEAWGSGRVPVGVNTNDTSFNTVEKTGGAKSHSYTPAGTNSKPTFTGTKATLSHTGGTVGSHTLTTSEIPAHAHSFKTGGSAVMINSTSDVTGAKAHGFAHGTSNCWWVSTNKNASTLNNTGGGGGHSHGFTQPNAHTYTPAGTNSAPTFTGTASTQDHLQPYITCYMWKRVA